MTDCEHRMAYWTSTEHGSGVYRDTCSACGARRKRVYLPNSRTMGPDITPWKVSLWTRLLRALGVKKT